MSESQGVGLGVDDRLVQPDLTDVDRFVGVPLGGTQFSFPIEERDVRRFVEAMGNPNPLHFDPAYAAASRFGRVVLPQSMNFSQSTLPEGNIPGSHSLNSGSELWFYGPRLYPGDSVQFDRMLYGYELKNTRFAGPTVFVRSDTTCVGGRGDFIFKRRYTRARYLVENARKLGGIKSPAEEPEWSDAALAEVDERKLRYIESLRGHESRPAASVAIGDALPEKVHGPHSVMTITLEAAARLDMLGSTWDNLALPLSHDFGGLASIGASAERVGKDPAAANIYLTGAGRVHLDGRFAARVGAGSRAYAFGNSLESWCVDYLANWAGEWGFVRHMQASYRYPAYAGDTTAFTGEVVDRWDNARSGVPTVQIEFKAVNQDDRVVIKGTGEVELTDGE